MEQALRDMFVLEALPQATLSFVRARSVSRDLKKLGRECR